MKIAVVVQRYGADINGGAELHARYIAERLSRHASVEVATTCARDYVTWKNELPQGIEQVNGITVRRFPVVHERRPDDFGRRSVQVFDRLHSIADEIRWLESEGPASPALVNYVERAAPELDFVVVFSYRYYHAWHVARRIPGKTVIVPTAERDPAIGLSIFGPVLQGVRGLMYNSPEERAMILAATNNAAVPGVVVGVGSDVPDRTDPERFRRVYKINRPFAIYIGRIDANKGCPELFAHFTRYAAAFPRGLDLVLIGSAIIDVPRHPRIHHLGFLEDRDKFDALAASDLLIMPSYFESLSMVALEAWALGRPVLANGRCDVLKGQCIRSNAGLYYESYEEFVEALYSLESNGPLNARLGRNGRDFFQRHYAWPVIERKYLDMFDRLKQERPAQGGSDGAGGPGWLARRKRDLPPSREILERLPKGFRRMSAGRVHQVLATLGYGDAIGHEVLGIQRVLLEAGYESEIFVETADRRLEHLTTDYREMVGAIAPEDVLIHHFSIGSRASRTAYALPGRMALVYHNITPPQYFLGVHTDLVKLCFRGRRELTAYISRCELALGDSEYNRRELEELGFHSTAVLPVVPDFGHLELPPDRMAAERFDDGWTNVIFVGRVIPNKKFEDVIRAFHVYRTRHNPRSRLLLVGSYGGFEKYLAMLHGLVARLGTPDVHFLGHVSNEELTALYDVADLFLCASEHEGFCVPLIESFYKRVPVLAYTATAVPATMDGGGVLYGEKDPFETARLMAAVLDDADLEDQVIAAQDAALERLLARDFGGTLLRFVNRIRSTAPRPAPEVPYDFWALFDQAERLEELRQFRPAVYRALPQELEVGGRRSEVGRANSQVNASENPTNPDLRPPTSILR